MLDVRPSKRPSVKSVQKWNRVYADAIDLSWRGKGEISVLIECGYPFPDFYRVIYITDGVKKSKLFYGESAWSKTEMFVYDLGFRSVLGRL